MFKRKKLKEKNEVNLIHPWHDIRSALPTALGEALLRMLDGVSVHDVDAIQKHANALITFGAADAEGADPDPTEAQEALHWVANNLLALWD